MPCAPAPGDCPPLPADPPLRAAPLPPVVSPPVDAVRLGLLLLVPQPPSPAPVARISRPRLTIEDAAREPFFFRLKRAASTHSLSIERPGRVNSELYPGNHG